ncbi:peptidylprolyl isomerase [Parablautia sp. Marseille-Q6255]|uniref:peptidylprolyl isomerase n=1 Tax=Parablautia sp. Marseille-Q6255 TaxID=3039593 RepID=UPI0024BC4B1A|nr:hypothetical protein [Parablautia sp. Marseille-Q6255]
MKGLKKAAALGLCTGLVVTSLAGCSKKAEFDAEATAITVNDDTIPVGVMNFAIRYNQANYESLYMSLGLTDPFNQDMYGAGTTLGDDMKSLMTTELTQALLAEQKMEEYDVALTDEQKNSITSAAKTFVEANDEEVLKELGTTQEHVERYLELSMERILMEEQMSADVDTEVSDEEAAQRKIQYTLFTPITDEQLEAQTETETEAAETEAAVETETEAAETETEAAVETETEAAAETETETAAETEAATEAESETAGLTEKEDVKTQSADETESEAQTDAQTEAESEAQSDAETETETETEDPEAVEAMERARVQAEEMLKKLKDGEEFEKAAEDMGKTASSTTFGADYSITELVEATDGLADGTLVGAPVKTESGYYVVRVVSEFDREATDAKKETIVEQRRQEQISSLYTQWQEEAKVSADEKVIETITFDYHLTQPTEAQTEAVSEAQTQAESETAAQAETQTESETAAQAEMQTESETAAQAETQTESETAAQAETQTESETTVQ